MFARFRRDLTKYWKYTIYAAKSQLKTEVANSYLNWIWWILEPLCFMLIYSFIFGYMMGRNSVDYYNAFIFIGHTIWDFFSRCIKGSVGMVKRNKSIISKVYLPKFTLILSEVMVNGFKMFICLGLSCFLLLYYRVPVDYHCIMALPVMCIFILFVFGASLIVMHIGVFVTDMSNVVSIGLKMLFYFTGIFYSIEKLLPQPYADICSKCNPVACLMQGIRYPILYQTTPDFKAIGIWFVVSIILCVLGVRLVYKNENTYVKVI